MGRAPTRPCSHAPACTFRGTLGLLTQHLCVALGAFVEETWSGSGCRLATLPLRKSALLHSALQAYPSKKVGNVVPHYLGIGNGIGPRSYVGLHPVVDVRFWFANTVRELFVFVFVRVRSGLRSRRGTSFANTCCSRTFVRSRS